MEKETSKVVAANTVKEEAKKAETKAAAAEVKKETAKKATTAKKETAKKATTAKKETAKKETAKKATTAKKTTAKKGEPTSKAFIQLGYTEIDVTEVVNKAIKAYEEEGSAKVENINVYIKPEENAAYYVVNDKAAGRVDIF